jgi:hypothetical protein
MVLLEMATLKPVSDLYDKTEISQTRLQARMEELEKKYS